MISASPHIENTFFGDNVRIVLSQNILQTESYILKAIRAPIESEIVRTKLSRLFLAVAMMRIKGSQGARRMDCAGGLLSIAVESKDEVEKQATSVNACRWLHISALALTASYVLEHSCEVAELLSYSYGILWALPYVMKGWSYDGCEAMLSLERKIKADHPDWATRPPAPTSAKSQGCATALFLCLAYCIFR
jgi:hypothetical protein